MSFDRPLVAEKLSKDLWKVHEEFTYTFKDYRVTVPAGFVTDLASVPRGFWNIVPKDGTYTQAAVLHDFMYGKHLFKRSICDVLFREAMKELGVGWFRRGTIYNAVRVFGWLPW